MVVGVSGDRPVQRNFLLPPEQAEWLREHAFRTRRRQAEIVREALSDYQARFERGTIAASEDGSRSLMERFRTGRGIDLDILRDDDAEMWSHDA
jgi:predicted DNA-binding protein